ncbi:restriction endonuclease subunit S [Methylomonas rivi]
MKVATGEIKVVSKIRFSDGGIEFRSGTDSKTGLIQCDSGDLLLSGINATKGAIAIWPEGKPAIAATIHYAAYRVNHNISFARYMWWFLRSQTFRDIIFRSLPDGIKTELKPKRLLPIKVPLPSLKDQSIIVNRLDQLTDKVRQIDQHLDAIDAVAEALLISLHHKFAAGRLVRLGDIIELFEESELIKPDGQYPQVGVRGFGGGLFAKPALAGTETSYRAFNRLYTDAIVLSQVKGWEGALAVCPPELAGMFVSPEYRTFHCKPDLASPVYLGELIRTPWFWSLLQAATRGVGARRERTRPEQFLNIELPMPEFQDQLKIVEILSRQNELKQRHTKIREANQALIPATLERLFSNAMGEHKTKCN